MLTEAGKFKKIKSPEIRRLFTFIPNTIMTAGDR